MCAQIFSLRIRSIYNGAMLVLTKNPYLQGFCGHYSLQRGLSIHGTLLTWWRRRFRLEKILQLIIKSLASLMLFLQEANLEAFQNCIEANKFTNLSLEQKNVNNNFFYSNEWIELAEYIYGTGYLSQGGVNAVYSQFDEINLNKTKLLDFGCGLGGPAIDLAKIYSVDITGIDIKEMLIDKAKKDYENVKDSLKGTVTFQNFPDAPILTPFASNYFDIVSSREVLFYIPCECKELALKEIFRVLKNSGKLIVVDWIKGECSFSKTSLEMMKKDSAEFNLITIEEYMCILTVAGFENIKFFELTDDYIEYTDAKMHRIENCQDEFKKCFGEDEYESAFLSWVYQKSAFQSQEIKVVKFVADKRI